MEDKAFVIFRHIRNQFLQLLYRPFVNLVHILIGNYVLTRVEIVGIAQKKPQGIPDFPIGILCASNQLIVAANIFLVIYTCHPEP